MVGRDRTRGNFMRAEIAKCAAGSEPILFLADLSSQAEIHRLAEKLRGSLSRIDVLINNAAAMFADREVTPEGLEKTFAINHLAPFILTHLVLDLIRAAPAGRILTASSEFHSGTLDFSDLQGERRYNWLGAYKRSKLCNILFTYELTPVYVASSPDLDGVSGRFFLRRRTTRTKNITYDIDAAHRLWNKSEALCESRATALSQIELRKELSMEDRNYIHHERDAVQLPPNNV